jgi:ligand-binding sensor domain-containing protein
MPRTLLQKVVAPFRDSPFFRRYRLRPGATRVERVSLPFVPACAAAHNGYLWVGTKVGLVRIRPDTGEEAWLTPREGFAGLQSIRALAADGDALWIASPVGITRVTLREFGKRSVPTRPVG